MSETNTQPTSPNGETPEIPTPTPTGTETPTGEEHTPIPPVTPEVPAVVPPSPETTTPPTPPAPEASVDYPKKFAESTRRNQIVEGQKAELEKVLADITKQERPTDEEMRASEPNWDYLSDFEKNQAIKTEILTRKQAKRDLEEIALRKAEEDQQKLEAYCFSEPKLKGKEEEFAKFATSKKNKGAPMEVLLNAFLFEVTPTPTPTVPTPPQTETPPSLNRSTPTGGNPPVETPQGLSDEDIEHIRKTDHKRYNEMVRTGQI